MLLLLLTGLLERDTVSIMACTWDRAKRGSSGKLVMRVLLCFRAWAFGVGAGCSDRAPVDEIKQNKQTKKFKDMSGGERGGSTRS